MAIRNTSHGDVTQALAGGHPQLSVIWHQGESDAEDPEYLKN